MAEKLPQDVESALHLASDARDHRKAAEIAEVIALSQAAELHEVAVSDVDHALEQLLQCRTGAPGVGEFFALEAAAVLGMSPTSALLKLQCILSIKHRHPFVWESFCEGKIWWWQASEVEKACADLSKEATFRVDAMLEATVCMKPWGQAVNEIEAMVKAADPELERRKQLLKAESRDVKIEKLEHGHSRFHGTLSARDAIDFENAIQERAKLLPDPELPTTVMSESFSPDALAKLRNGIKRSLAVGELARASFGQDALPVHQLVIHMRADDAALDPESDETGTATVEQWGTLLSEDLPMLLTGSKVVVRPVVDSRTLPGEHQHDPTERLRFAIQQRDQVEIFPYGTRPSRSCDLDHTEPYIEGGGSGQTNPGNLGPLSRRPHRAKTFGGFQLTQLEPGLFHWKTPHGWEFLVGPFGTQKIASPPRCRPPEEAPPDLEDCWRMPPVVSDEPPPPESVAWPIIQHALFDTAA